MEGIRERGNIHSDGGQEGPVGSGVEALVESLSEVIYEILAVFEADGQSHEALIDAHFSTHGRVYVLVRGVDGLADKGLDAAEAGGTDG